MKSSTAPRCKRWLGLPVRGFYNPCGPWGDFFPVNHRVLGALALQSLGGGGRRWGSSQSLWFYFNEKNGLWKLWGFRKLLPVPSSPSLGLGERGEAGGGAAPWQWVLCK